MRISINKLLKAPFCDNRDLFFVLCLLAGSADLFYWTIRSFSYPDTGPLFGAYMFMHSFVMVYLIVFLCGLIKGKLYKVAKWIFIALGVVNLCIDTGVHVIMGYGFNEDFVAVIMGTNAGEAKEFLEMYVNKEMVLFVVTVLTLSILISLCSDRLPKTPDWVALTGVAVFVFSCIVIGMRHSNKWNSVYLMKINTFLQYKKVPDLRSYSQTYDMTQIGRQPENVVLIIGESLNKNHMSLYGYNKSTTPVLDSLEKTNNLVVFDEVSSSGIMTIKSFVSMMTTLKSSDVTQDWSSDSFFLDFVKSAGYDVRWISNQASVGVHDNVVARFAELSDSLVWCGTKFMGVFKHDLDSVVLAPVKKRSEEPGKRKFTLVHLNGSHQHFRSRYPDTYSIYKSQDYGDYPEQQRNILAEYDNSVCYNDWIVGSIIDCFKPSDAIIIYLSDHALDIFESSPDYAGHARGEIEASVKAAKQIPFLIYMTDGFIQQSDSTYQRIVKSVHKPFETENLMYAIMDIMGVDFSGENQGVVKQYSLFTDATAATP